MSDWNDDPWIRAHSLLTPEKMHAIGYITLAWNHCEYWAGALMADVLNVPERVSRAVTHDLGDMTLWNKLIDVAISRSITDTAVEDLRHAQKLYERSRSNRNHYVHAATIGSQTTDGSALKLGRWKGPGMATNSIPDELSDIRRVADDMAVLLRYLRALSLLFAGLDGGTPWTSPERPPLPEFVWKAPLQTQPKQKRPPQSSEA